MATLVQRHLAADADVQILLAECVCFVRSLQTSSHQTVDVGQRQSHQSLTSWTMDFYLLLKGVHRWTQSGLVSGQFKPVN